MSQSKHSRQKVCYYYDGEIGNYYYGAAHPMKPHRVKMAHNLIVNYGLYHKMTVYRPQFASEEDMTKFHSDEYIHFLKTVKPHEVAEKNTLLQKYRMGDDCPIFEGLFSFSQLSSGGSLAAAVKINRKESDICINWGGGLHHAKKSEASGFCYVNDIVLAILELLKYNQRVLYIDIDVHHGDGVEEAFFTTDRVMTVSFHKHGEGFFPGTGGPDDIGAGPGKYYALNIALKKGMNDGDYETLFVPVLSKVMETYQPNAIVLQCGADSLTGDRLGDFNLTLRGHGKCVEFMKTFDVPLILLGGGGYTIRNVSRCWAYETSIAVGADISNDLPINDYYGYYEPDHKLHINPANTPNANTPKDLEDIKMKAFENLRMLSHAPSVPIQAIPEDNHPDESKYEDHKNDMDIDVRLSQTYSDKRIQLDNEYSDSEDEGEGGRRDNHSYKDMNHFICDGVDSVTV